MSILKHTYHTDGFPNRETNDTDFYKWPMLQFILKFYKDVRVRFSLINRDKAIPLAEVVPEATLRAALDAKRAVRFKRRELDANIAYMRGMRMHGQNMFSEEFFDYIEKLELPPYELRRVDSQYELSAQGLWSASTNWEIPFMQIPVELYYRELLKRMTPMEREVLYARAKDLLYRELAKLAQSPYHPKVMLFCTRRRNSFLWERFVTEMCVEVLGEQLIGTSNVWMANHFNLMPMGTNAHELPMVATAIAPPEKKREMQYKVLSQWETLYGKFLRICLPDTFGTAQFLNNAPEWLRDWRGFRDDSGDVFENTERYIDWYKERDIAKPKAAGKIVIPSDGLCADKVLQIAECFDRYINLSYGIGTQLGNQFFGCHPTPDKKVPGLDITWAEAFRAFSIVAKPEIADGNPVAKLTNNIAKATGLADTVSQYVDIFGQEGRITERVVV